MASRSVTLVLCLLLQPISLTTTAPLGAGPLAGLNADGLFSILVPPGTAPFNVQADAAGGYTFTLPPGSLPGGLQVDVVAFGQVTGGVLRASAAGRITF